MIPLFYDIFAQQCLQKGVSRNKACIDCGISRTSVAKWKKGATPNGATLSKLAAYFGVTADALLGGGSSAKPAITDADLKQALFASGIAAPDALLDEVKRYAAYLEQNHK